MIIYFLFTISLIVSSCSTLEPLTYKDVQWDGTSSAKVLEKDKFDVNSDIEFLKYSLEKAYIGSDFIDEKSWNRFLRRIDVIEKKKYENNIDFCKQLGKEFLGLPDGHFNIWFPGYSCYSPSKIEPNVGNNYISNFKNAIYKTKIYSSKQTILIAISHFPHSEDKGWDGFSNTLKKLKKYKNVIIDLRENGGGDSRRGLELARFLLNPSIEHNRMEIVRKNTPEAWTIFRNGILRKKISKDANDLPTNHLVEYLKEIDENRKKSLTSNKRYLSRKFKKPSLEKINFDGNIYVLTDKGCGSSCEHTLEALKFHPKTKVVGQNTFGAIHYGQMGIIRLPSSGVYVQLATQYFKLFEEGYFDKIGYTPDITVPAGKDALSFLLQKIPKL